MSQPDISDRIATRSDLPLLVAIEQSAFPQSRWASESTLLQRMNLHPAGTWLGLLKGVPVAFSNGFPIRDLTTQEALDPPDPVLFYPEGTVWLLRNLAVSKDHQRQGVGKLLVRRQIVLARDFGARHLRFTAPADLDNYYSALGFQKICDARQFHGLPQAVWELRL